MPKHPDKVLISKCCGVTARLCGRGDVSLDFRCTKCQGRIRVSIATGGQRLFKNGKTFTPFPSPCCQADTVIVAAHIVDGTYKRTRRCWKCERKFRTEVDLKAKGKNNGQKTDRRPDGRRTPKHPRKGPADISDRAGNNRERFVCFCKPRNRRGARRYRPSPAKRAADSRAAGERAVLKEFRAVHGSHDLPPVSDSGGGNGERGAMGQVERARKCLECGEKMRFGNSPVCQDCAHPRTEFEYKDPRFTITEETFS